MQVFPNPLVQMPTAFVWKGFAKKRLTGLYGSFNGSYDKCKIFLAAVLFRSIIYAKYNLKTPFHSSGNQIQSQENYGDK